MPRLDVWLVENGHFSSRQVAKRAIKEGMVTIDGKPCKPSKKVSGDEDIRVSPDYADKPMGYHKLKEIDELLGGKLVTLPCIALDIGSSAGGFLAYLNDKGAKLMLSNSDPKNEDADDDFFDDLYSEYYVYRVMCSRMVNCDGDKRGLINEILVTNYDADFNSRQEDIFGDFF